MLAEVVVLLVYRLHCHARPAFRSGMLLRCRVSTWRRFPVCLLFKLEPVLLTCSGAPALWSHLNLKPNVLALIAVCHLHTSPATHEAAASLPLDGTWAVSLGIITSAQQKLYAICSCSSASATLQSQQGFCNHSTYGTVIDTRVSRLRTLSWLPRDFSYVFFSYDLLARSSRQMS